MKCPGGGAMNLLYDDRLLPVSDIPDAIGVQDNDCIPRPAQGQAKKAKA
jgi:hypothetical protein